MQIFHNNLEVIVEEGEYVFPSLFIISTDIHICTSIIMRSISVIGKSKGPTGKRSSGKGQAQTTCAETILTRDPKAALIHRPPRLPPSYTLGRDVEVVDGLRVVTPPPHTASPLLLLSSPLGGYS
jgi:hypothetical protein